MANKIVQAVKVLKQGGIILYPTEGVWGLGCDPFNETAVRRLLKIKKRSIDKGLICDCRELEASKKFSKNEFGNM